MDNAGARPPRRPGQVCPPPPPPLAVVARTPFCAATCPNLRAPQLRLQATGLPQPVRCQWGEVRVAIGTDMPLHSAVAACAPPKTTPNGRIVGSAAPSPIPKCSPRGRNRDRRRDGGPGTSPFRVHCRKRVPHAAAPCLCRCPCPHACLAYLYPHPQPCTSPQSPRRTCRRPTLSPEPPPPVDRAMKTSCAEVDS